MPTYPQAIRSFTQKRDYTDDVMASHVNDLQDEVKALQTILGVMPHNDSSLTSTVVGWADLKTRFKSMAEGDQVHAWQAFMSTSVNVGANQPNTHAVPFGAPGVGSDIFGLWNGTGVTIKRAGWYNVTLYAAFNYSSLPGYREVGIRIGGGWLAHTTQGVIENAGDNPGSHFTVTAPPVPLPAGTVLTPVARHGCAGTLQLAVARFGGHWIRAL